MARKAPRKKRRSYSDELKAEAVQMMLDGHSAESVAANLGLSGTPLLYRWKAQLLQQAGPAAASLEQRIQQLQEELRRVERERDILKKALAIFSQKM
jgi:transposase